MQDDNPDTIDTTSSSSSYGRAVKLHFYCRAPLPMGSTLRITSSHLWAPTNTTNSTTNDSSPGSVTPTLSSSQHLSSSSNNNTISSTSSTHMVEESLTPLSASEQETYASSVEMVTCPETYPLWKTKTPVIVSLRRHHGDNQVQVHRYRYLVVTPGVECQSHHYDKEVGDHGSGRVRSSGEEEFDHVMCWEDPFQELNAPDSLGTSIHKLSNTSLPSLKSVKRQAISKTLANLPFRTIEINVHSGNVTWDPIEVDTNLLSSSPTKPFSFGGGSSGGGGGLLLPPKGMGGGASLSLLPREDTPSASGATTTKSPTLVDGVICDTWNNANDYTYHAYILRNAINKQNRVQSKLALQQQQSTDFGSLPPSASGSYPEDVPLTPDPNRQGLAKLPSRVSFLMDQGQDDGNTVDGEDGGTVDADMASSTTPHSTPPTSGRNTPTTPKPSLLKLGVSNLSLQSTPKPKKRILFVCFHLPVIVTRDPHSKQWEVCWSESLLAATEGSDVIRDYDCHWVGTVTPSERIESEDDRRAVMEVLKPMKCTPIFLEEGLQRAHYLGMCKQVLWPAFHNIDLLDLSASGFFGNVGGGREGVVDEMEEAKVDGAGNVVTPPMGGGTGSSQLTQMRSEWDQSRLDGWWYAYAQVNSIFSDQLSRMLQPGDIMWVHDYHLALLPKLMDEVELNTYNRLVTKKIFLLHIPFPTSQVFRELECGEAILEGMLHADVVGFHAFDHARHFLNAAKRILGLNYESLVGGLIGVQCKQKTVLVTMHNVSIEAKMVNAALSFPMVSQGTVQLRQKHKSRRIIAGVDIAQRLSGISLKLLAFQKLLHDYPIYIDQVVLVQKCLLPGSRSADEEATMKEIRALVQSIKNQYGPDVIDCEEIRGSSLPIVQRLSLWKASSVLMVTPIREGFNFLPMEYVYTKKAPAPPGVVISSEFSVVCSVLNGALRVNPYDVQMTVSSMDKALSMDEQEKENRRFRDADFVRSSSSSKFTKAILKDLYDATDVANGTTDDNDSAETSILGTKFDRKKLITSTAAFLAQEQELAFTHLDSTCVQDAYNRSKKRVFFLDLNGTIVVKEPPGKYLKREILGTSGYKAPQEICQALSTLCADPNNTVFVVSGDSQENVEEAIGHIPRLGLAASNGACFAPPLKPGETARSWKFFDKGVDWDAVKKIVLPVLAKYTARSNGSFVKMTHSSIGWSYYSCDPEWGSLQASHLVIELGEALRPFDVRFVMIKGIVEIVPRRINKGLIVKSVLREVAAQGDSGLDFILCMGDDVQDEKMFTSVLSFIAETEDPVHAHPSPPVFDVNGKSITTLVSSNKDNSSDDRTQSSHRVNDPLYAFTCAVGKKASHAFTYVDCPTDVSNLLLKLAKVDYPKHQRSKSFDAMPF